MSLLLAADDVAAGDYVTVHSVVPRIVRMESVD